MGEDISTAIRRAGGRPERAGVIGKLAEGERGSATGRVAAIKALEPSLFDGPNELLRRATGRIGSEARSTSAGGSDFNARLRAGFGHQPVGPAPEVDPDAPPVWGDAEAGARSPDPRGSRVDVGAAVDRAIRAAQGRPSEIDLFGEEEA